MNRFERVQKMIGNSHEDDKGEVHTSAIIAPCSPYVVGVRPEFLTMTASTDRNGCFLIRIEASIGCLLDKDRRFIEIDVYDKDDLESLRDFLNYWLEEEKEEVIGAVVTSEIDPIFATSIEDWFIKKISRNNWYRMGRTVLDLVRTTPEDVRIKMTNIGVIKMNMIKEQLRSKGLWLGMTEEDIRNWKPQI